MENESSLNEEKVNRVTEKILKLVTDKKLTTNHEIKKKRRKYKRKEKQLTPEQIQVFKQAFEIFDTDHSGCIDHSQLTSLLEALGFTYNQQQIQAIFDEVDDDGSGVIQVTQFIKFMSMQIVKYIRYSQIHKI